MKELIKKIEKREEFFKNLLSIFLKKNIIEIEEHEVILNNKTYHLFYSYQTQTIIIDGLFHDAIDVILRAEFIVKAIFNKYEFSLSDIFNMMFISSYVDNKNNLNLRTFTISNFDSNNFSNLNFPTVHEFTTSQVKNIIKELNNDSK